MECTNNNVTPTDHVGALFVVTRDDTRVSSSSEEEEGVDARTRESGKRKPTRRGGCSLTVPCVLYVIHGQAVGKGGTARLAR